jgi:hypothetical protein
MRVSSDMVFLLYHGLLTLRELEGQGVQE